MGRRAVHRGRRGAPRYCRISPRSWIVRGLGEFLVSCNRSSSPLHYGTCVLRRRVMVQPALVRRRAWPSDEMTTTLRSSPPPRMACLGLGHLLCSRGADCLSIQELACTDEVHELAVAFANLCRSRNLHVPDRRLLDEVQQFCLHARCSRKFP